MESVNVKDQPGTQGVQIQLSYFFSADTGTLLTPPEQPVSSICTQGGRQEGLESSLVFDTLMVQYT